MEETSLISLHLGSGASAAAIQNGKSIDTTMGLTPLEGLPGATRSGSIDPSLVFHYTSDASSLARSSTKELHISVAEDILNKQAGWYSMVGTTDFGKVVQGMHDGDEKMRLVFDLFVDRVVGYIGNYFVKLGGKVDALTFSGGIGERSEDLRKAVTDKVACLGFKLNDILGGANGNRAVTKLGPNVLLIKTNEEVCPMIWLHVKVNRGLINVFFLSSRWHGSVHKINASGNEGNITVPFTDSGCIYSLFCSCICTTISFCMQAGSAFHHATYGAVEGRSPVVRDSQVWLVHSTLELDT